MRKSVQSHRLNGRAPKDKEAAVQQLTWLVVALSTVVIGLFISLSGSEGFRLPKDLAFRAEAILLTGLFATAVIGQKHGVQRLLGTSALSFARAHRTVLLTMTAITGWTLIAAAFSSNRLLSWIALSYVFSAVIVFVGTFCAVGNRSLNAVTSPLILPAVVNSALALLQNLDIWNPLSFDVRFAPKFRTTALLGNSNDVGSYLVPMALALIASAVTQRRKFLWLIAAMACIGVMASQALAAIGALFVGTMVMLFINARLRSSIAIFVTIAIATVTMSLAGPLRDRVNTLRKAWEEKDLSKLSSTRIFPFATAWMMFADKPITGMGPGAFKFHYMDYRRQFNEAHPHWLKQSPENFGEVHCDHLQILAESGLPGYVLFLVSLGMIAATSFRPPAADEKTAFGRLLGLPFAASMAVLMLAAFPLELAASTQVVLYLAAIVLRWSS